jgi:hypothetical protein
MPRFLPAVTAVAVVLLSGLVHGLWTDRWASADEPAAVAAKFDDVPLDLGDWHGQPLDNGPRQTEPLAGYIYRRYVHRRSGATVTVALVCGRPGPTSIHTPEVCYGASGFDVSTKRPFDLPFTVGDRPARFFVSEMARSRAAEQTHLRIFWAWNGGGAWEVADNPRLAFARHAVLHKLYVIREMRSPNEPLDSDPCLDLMQTFLPELHRAVFASP